MISIIYVGILILASWSVTVPIATSRYPILPCKAYPAPRSSRPMAWAHSPDSNSCRMLITLASQAYIPDMGPSVPIWKRLHKLFNIFFPAWSLKLPISKVNSVDWSTSRVLWPVAYDKIKDTAQKIRNLESLSRSLYNNKVPTKVQQLIFYQAVQLCS